MSSSLFNSPEARELSGRAIHVAKVELRHFDAALVVAHWLEIFNWDLGVQQLHVLEKDQPVRAAVATLLAACITVDGADAPLAPADIETWPIAVVAEAIALVLEVNMDFFSQTLPRLAATAKRMGSIGSELLSSLSALATTPSA